MDALQLAPDARPCGRQSELQAKPHSTFDFGTRTTDAELPRVRTKLDALLGAADESRSPLGRIRRRMAARRRLRPGRATVKVLDLDTT